MSVYSAGGYCWVSIPTLTGACNEAWDLRRSWFMQTPQTGWRKLYARALRVMLEAGPAHMPDPMTQIAKTSDTSDGNAENPCRDIPEPHDR